MRTQNYKVEAWYQAEDHFQCFPRYWFEYHNTDDTEVFFQLLDQEAARFGLEVVRMEFPEDAANPDHHVWRLEKRE